MPTPAPIRAVHLDFKGVMFKPAYLPKLIADLADQSINAILVEYETTFPFKNIDASDDPATLLTLRQIKTLTTAAKNNNIQVIPLVQCLGHLEYILNKKRYKHLAIPHKFYDTIDPTNPRAVALVIDMLTQVIDAHPGITHIHLGMDEATSLTQLARQKNRDVLDLFTDHLESLLAIVESRNIKPIIWADMLQDFYKPALFDRFKHRVILSPWEYAPLADEPQPFARLAGGARIDKTWRSEPGNAKAPPVTSHTRFIQDMPLQAQSALKPYRLADRHILRHFDLDLFTSQGFTCLPASALRISSHGSVLPPFHQLIKNQQSWAAAIHRIGPSAIGMIGTSWARARSFKPPNSLFDLTWPIIHEMARLTGANPKPFWPDIPAQTLQTLLHELTRTREDWRIDSQILAQLQSLLPKIKTHRYEFQTLLLMLQTHAQLRAADIVLNDIIPVLNAPRLVPEDFPRRLSELSDASANISALQTKTLNHLARRYHGAALTEWSRYVYTTTLTKLAQTKKACLKTKPLAQKFWSR